MSDRPPLVVDEFDAGDEHPQDLKGCFTAAFRLAGCMAWLYITMFIAIVLVAILSLLFFR